MGCVSRGEFVLFEVLSYAGLTGGMVTQESVVLRFTVPDFLWPQKKLAVYLEGDV